MRVLGVPSRVVTVFNAAHDTDGNLSVEEYYSSMGEKLNLSKDSVWSVSPSDWIQLRCFLNLRFDWAAMECSLSDLCSWIDEHACRSHVCIHACASVCRNFHVWVECWMRRSDLGGDFDGWQVVDPTPQERSAGEALQMMKHNLSGCWTWGSNFRKISRVGLFRCGPCPIAAIQRRCLRAPHDTAFVYASVDADIVRLIVHNGRVVGRTVDSECVGQLIYTKRINSDAPQNLTQAYKGKRGEKDSVSQDYKRPIWLHFHFLFSGRQPVRNVRRCWNGAFSPLASLCRSFLFLSFIVFFYKMSLFIVFFFRRRSRNWTEMQW